MKARPLNELKKELEHLSAKELAALCLRLAKHKTENKELLGYLLYDADEQERFVEEVKAEMDADFATMNTDTVFFAKKTLRKILRNVSKYAKFSANKQVETELLLYFCKLFQESGLPIHAHALLFNMQARLHKKISTLIKGLHEDLQYDYQKELDELMY